MFFLGAIILSVFEILHIVLNFETILPGFLRGISFDNLYGSWNNFAIFFGAVITMSLITLELGHVGKIQKISLNILAILSLFFLIITNNVFVWILTGIFAIIVFVYSVSSQQFLLKKEELKEKKLPILPLVVILVSLLFIFSSNSLGTILPNYFGVVSNEVRPSLLSTLEIAKKSFFHNPVFGTGPNTFVINWSMWRPDSIALSQFWNFDFIHGFSTYFTILSTTGIIGFLSFSLFLIVFIFRGIQSLFIAFRNPKINYFIFGSFSLALYFWIVVIFFVPNIVNIMFAFSFTGVFLGSLVHRKVLPIYEGSFLKDPRTSFFSILGLVVFLIISTIFTYIYISKFIGTIYVSKVQNTNIDDNFLNNSEKNLLRAINMNNQDDYYRVLSQLYLNKLNSINTNDSISEDTAKLVFQNTITQAENSALNATKLNPKYYINWTNLGDVYTAFASIGINNAYDNAINSYKKARNISLNNPSILLSMAQLEVYNKNNSEARNLINQALQIKPNYVDAMFAMSRLDANEGNLENAIKQAERAISIEPNNASVFFNLGILRYNNKDYLGSASAFDTALRLYPNYTNARYFLGLSYQKIGRIQDARDQFELLNKLFPENEDIKQALVSLNNGKNILDYINEDKDNIKDLPVEDVKNKK